MVKKYKALICDIDGTLIPLKRDGKPSQKLIEAIIKAQKYVHVGFATARPWWMVEEIAKSLNLSGPSILGGGSEIVDTKTGELLWEKFMETEVFEEICNILDKYNLTIYIKDGEQTKDLIYSKKYKANKPYHAYVPALDSKLVDELLDQMSKYPTISALKVSSWTAGKYDFMVSHALATKQHGVFEISKILNIEPEEMIGVGDSYNDFPLLMACGLKVAMGNAVEDLKAIADYIAPTVEEDGVVDVIEKYILPSN